MAAGARTVLVVDDDVAIRLICRLSLELEGLEVAEADGLAAAEAAVAAARPAAVVLDLGLGGDDGGALLERLGGTPVVLLTGADDVPQEVRSRVAAVVAKPFDPDELARSVGALVGAA